MQSDIYTWLVANKISYADVVAGILASLGVVLSGLMVYLIAYVFLRIFRSFFYNKCAESKFPFLQRLSKTYFFTYIKLVFVGIILNKIIDFWLNHSSFALGLHVFSEIWVIIFWLLVSFSLLDAFSHWSHTKPFLARLPMRGLIQTVKLILSIFVGIIVISLLIDKSPTVLLSGVGAMTAVLMLVFKDPILGLVAGIQLSANNMLKIGDWLEMPQYSADGEVIDIGLTTVKVRNWDSTTTSLPTYALISNSFRNWQSMSDSGGRRLKRSISIDVNGVHFMTPDELNALAEKHTHLADTLKKMQGLNVGGQESNGGNATQQNGITNIGAFRVYLADYLKHHPKIRQDLTVMVRQLAPTSNGIPLELYCFIADVRWVFYEGIQADIFDHIYAMVADFGLRIHQAPTGFDIQSLSKEG